MKIRTFVSQDYFSCNMYVCSVDNVNFLVDPGYFDKKVKDYIDSIGGISFILITHGHYDHIGGLNEIKKVYPEVPVYAYKDEMEVIFTNRKNVAFHCLDRGADFRSYVPECDVISLEEGSHTLFNLNFDLIHTPGHTQGGCMYYFKKENAIFMGDTIIGESIGRYDLPTASEKDMEESLAKVKNYPISEETNCYFGHGPMYNYAVLIKKNVYLRNA